jgi:glucokinase
MREWLQDKTVLNFGACGGAYIAGGISPRILNFMARSEFRNRFEAKGRLRRFRQKIPKMRRIEPVLHGRPGTRRLLGPGTGLGVACLVPGFAKPIVVASEGGHATLAGVCDREDEIIKQLRKRF